MTRTAILFPGQGAQTVGMGKDFHDACPAAARIYREAADVLGWDVAAVCFNGPQAELDRTAICQPAILTTSVAIMEAMREAGFPGLQDISAAAGLSLGEYTALVAAGSLRFADAVKLVQKRGQYMEEACKQNPGAMMSVIGMEDEIVEAACAEAGAAGVVVPANYNSPGQLVISGSVAGTARAAELLRARGARRVLPLAVSGAFHSPLMASAAARLEQALAATAVASPAITVYANVTAAPVAGPDEIRESLARQVSSPVRWAQAMKRMVADGYGQFVEVGPGKVLTGLMKRIAPEASVTNVSSLDVLKSA